MTGVDTDRLPEERRRGISIDLGFAPLALPSGRALSVVDVPGHERLVRTMIAGASGIDLVLLVVACDDGVMPQTREHLAICQLLGIERAVVALTKRDAVDDETAELARVDVEELLEGTPYAGAPLVETAAPTGAGLTEPWAHSTTPRLGSNPTGQAAPHACGSTARLRCRASAPS